MNIGENPTTVQKKGIKNMMLLVYAITGLAGGVLTGLAGLTAAMVVTPILCSVCGWSAYDAVTLSLIANVPSALATCRTFYKNGNLDMKRGLHVAIAAFAGAVVGSYLGYLFSMVSENGISYFVIISNLFMAVKFFMPTHALPQMPCAGLKFLNAIITPYIGIYVKQMKMMIAGSISRYNPQLRLILAQVLLSPRRRVCAMVSFLSPFQTVFEFV